MKLPSPLKRLRNLSPPQAIALYYGVAIFLGAALLATPQAARGGRLSFLDALFTATSAQCVTGLSVLDIGTRLSTFGQLIVLLLIQLGGLGITTFSVYLFIYLKKGVSMQGRWIVQETLMHTPVSSWQGLIRSIFVLTLVIEGGGALLLAMAFVPEQGFASGLYSAVFHSVSAFCNAGFSLYPDSLVGYRDDALVNLTVMALILLGGIGFLVMRELMEYFRAKSRKGKVRRRLSLHSTLVLWTTSFLILYGTVMIAWLEADGALAGMSLSEGFWTSLFQSVTARTAGFNTIDLNAFRAPTLFLIIFLMFIGASPGSAGGGIKTTSLALFVGALYNRLKGSSHTSLFGRTVPEELVTKAMVLVFLAIILIGIALFGLMIAQSPDLAHENPREFLGYCFETFSAFATVGLSLGATAKLGAPGKTIVILLMFVGRVGLLTLAFAIAGRTRRHAPHYAEESVMIG